MCNKTEDEMDMPVNCLICREPANENCVTLGEKGVASLIQACKSRGEHSLLEDIEEKYTRKNITVHKNCRKRFTDLRGFDHDDEKKANQPPQRNYVHHAITAIIS